MKNDKEGKENRLLNTAFKLFTEKGIKETIDWYLNNEEWLNAIKDGSYKNSYKD